jgi:acyl dehydratase
MKAGDELAAIVYRVTRADLVRYAGASGDFNPIHWSDRIASQVGLPGVIAHGMYTMALAGRAVAEWTNYRELLELSTKFTQPVVVPDTDEGVTLRFVGTVKEVSDSVVALTLQATCGEIKVLGMTKALVRV